MKSFNKILSSLFILCLLLGFSACTEEAKYDPAAAPGNAQVYFPSTMPSTVALSQDLSVTSFDVNLNRVDKSNALTVNLAVQNESPDIFNVPSTASFAAGDETTKITITYDPSKLDYDVYKSISISVSDESLTTPYGNSVYSFTAGIPAPWKSLGKATFMDTWMFSNPYSIELQQHMLDPTRFRLVDPYTPGLNAEGYIPNFNKGDQSPYLEFQVLPKGSVYKNVTTTVDGLVVYGDINTGYYNTSNSYNQDVWLYHPSRFTSMPTENFWLHNIVIQYSDDGQPAVVQLAPYYYMVGIGGWNYTQNDGVVTIVFPGVVLADYSAGIEYTGRYTDANDNSFAVANVTLGADVEYAKVAVVPGNLTQEALDGIIDGSIESTQITAGGTVQRPCSSAGKYTYVVVTYAGDEEKDYASTSFNFSTGDAAVTYPVEDFYGDYIMTGLSIFDDSEMDPAPVTIAEGTDPNTVVITGIQYAASVTATFPVKGFMSIAPQQLANYGQYDIAWYSVTPDFDVNDTDAMIFTRLESGDIVMTSDSYAIGYALYSNAAGGYVDGYYNVSFTPASSSNAAALKAASVAKPASASVIKVKANNFGKQSKILRGKTAIPAKGSVKKALRENQKVTTPSVIVR